MGGDVLIVDDDRDTAAVLRDYFVENGQPTDIALDGNDAVRKFREGKHGLLIVDVNLPDMDGFAFAARIKQRARDVKILFLTGSGERLGELPAGQDYGFLEKPMRPAMILAKVRAMLERSD